MPSIVYGAALKVPPENSKSTTVPQAPVVKYGVVKVSVMSPEPAKVPQAGLRRRPILPVPFVPGDPPSQVPLEQMSLDGEMDDVRVVGLVTGVIPAIELAEDVLAPLIPEEGSGNLSKEQLLETLRTFANLDTMADIDLGDERRAVSCAFIIEAEPAAWEE